MNTDDVSKLKERIKNLETLLAAKQIELDASEERVVNLEKRIDELVGTFCDLNQRRRGCY